jgi:hypothetical protein
LDENHFDNSKVKHPKACFTIEYHLCHIDDQSILAAIVRDKVLCFELWSNTRTFSYGNKKFKTQIHIHIQNVTI